ncbi:MAG: Ig-like domain-containing protein, partial [Bacteroidota bacterium]
MKKFLMAALCSVASTVALAQIDSVFVEKFYVSNAADAAGSVGALPVGSVTWRFYIDLAPGHELQAVYGNAAHQLRFQTTTGFFNNEDRGATTANAIGASFLDDNSVYLDSYISVGAVGANRLGVPKVEDNTTNNIPFVLLQNADPSAGFPLTQRDGANATAVVVDAVTAVNISTELSVFDATSNAGNLFSTTNGSWANLNGSEGPNATNRVLVAQITTNGVLSYELNVQVRNTTTLQVFNYVASNPAAGEVTIAGLTGTLNQPNTLPTVSLTSPTNGASFFVGNSVTISANAADADGSVSQVEFLVDGAVVNTDNTAPYTYNWTATAGNHVITARATDNAGGQTTSTAVNISVGVVVPPTV